ncbi:MAG TPA: hypothetical protein VM432_05190 [Bdellovibrionales bacterium]|nr:hypothetical protein [Bdellovibrionales bacterium]
MSSRDKKTDRKSTLSSSSYIANPTDSLNPRISEDEYRGAMGFDTSDETNEPFSYDVEVEDTFPASDPPSTSPMTGVGRNVHERRPKDPSGLSKNFKNDKVEQFEYGRRSEASTLHFDPSTERLRRGNPDVGNVDLGTIEADKPAQPDDNDHFDTADEEKDPANEV